MKTNSPSAPRRIAAACILILGIPPALPAEPSAPGSGQPAAAAPKPYSLYLGADLSLVWEGKPRPVLDVQGSTFVVDVDGRRVAVPTRSDLSMKVDRALKVGPTGIVIAKFQADRAYTAQNDPERLRSMANHSISAAIGAATAQDANLAMLQNAQQIAQNSEMQLGASRDPNEARQLDAAISGVQSAYSDLDDAFISSTADFYGRAEAEKAHGRFDAFRLTFELSSPKPLSGLYLVATTVLQEDPQDPKTLRQWVYAQRLDPIGPKPTTFRLFRGGFPPGYKLVGVQVHLYQAGVELDTTIAPKRVEISAEEAFQFSVADYVGRHRGATLGPVAVHIGLSKSLRSRLPADALDRTYYVKVSKNGAPLGAFADESCAENIPDPELATALTAMRFYPALKAGRPVEAVVALRP